ncbi:LysM domain-containing protein [uncultured Anaerovibrio sp.]|uniref:LysM peptidoglycan-binding domain-containing protein n=1 Tax=uncultured Anaerovibrio sp. TaxID=361586 RepID=UPI002611E968|nr:LysM domain-containing protein [uncultured Anaerovibrio sp.]
MKNIVIALLIGLALLSPFNLTNSYLRASEFDTVVLQQGDTVEGIAGRYTSDSSQLEELTVAIKEINDIKSDRDMRVGRRLQVPVINEEASKVQVASRE